AGDGRTRGAGTALASLVSVAECAVVAPSAVGGGGVRALPGRGIARAREVARVERTAGDGRTRGARTALARLASRAKRSVIARGAVRRRRVGALPVHRIADSRDVARVERRADHRSPGHARAKVAMIALRARVLVGAPRTLARGARRRDLVRHHDAEP